MMMLWAVSIIPFGAYAIIQDFAIPLQLQPQFFGVLALIAWGQTFYYDSYVKRDGNLCQTCWLGTGKHLVSRSWVSWLGFLYCLVVLRLHWYWVWWYSTSFPKTSTQSANDKKDTLPEWNRMASPSCWRRCHNLADCRLHPSLCWGLVQKRSRGRNQ